MPDLEQPESASNSLKLYPDAVYEGARVLNMDVKFVATCYDAVQLVYNRRYSEAKAAFEAAQRRYPDSALGPIGKVLIYQALMLHRRSRFPRSRSSTAPAGPRPGPGPGLRRWR